MNRIMDWWNFRKLKKLTKEWSLKKHNERWLSRAIRILVASKSHFEQQMLEIYIGELSQITYTPEEIRTFQFAKPITESAFLSVVR